LRRLPLLVICSLLLSQFIIRGASRPAGWDDATHSRDAVPDYSRVFAADRVGRLDIEISSVDWQAVVDDMNSMAGAFSVDRPQIPTGGGPANPIPGGGVVVNVTPEALAACTGRVVGDACSVANATNGRCTLVSATALACVGAPGGFTGGGAGGGPGGNPGNPPGGNAGGNAGRGNNGADDVDLFPRTPIYIPADLSFDGVPFSHVGFRLKGNSSLSTSWRSGIDKLPFRLNIDYLEDRFPEIRDQRFFGFPNLAFSSNSNDTSFLRQRIVTDLFREAGVPAPRTAYVRVFMNRGAGSFYMGLYTLTEVPDSPMLEQLFGSDDGNLYKPVGTGGRWTQFFPLSFPKKTNEADEDWTDVQGAIEALNASRTSAAAWRARLEARFEVNGFLRWLALNTIIGNFDTYGGLSAHNYYLYGSPRHRDRLFWMAWDHDLAMNGGGLGGGAIGNPGGGPGGGPNAAAGLDLFLDGTGANWPLIRFLLDDPTYRAVYRRHVTDLLNTVFEPNAVVARLRAEHARIAPYVVGGEGEEATHTFITNPAQFTTALPTLEAYVRSRHAAALAALAAR
jgi:spore coat protein H